MLIYIGIDDTDNLESGQGTGKLARGVESMLPDGAAMISAVRQQLLVDDRVPYTSHNSSACVTVELADAGLQDLILERLEKYLQSESASGSDPGLCLAWKDGPGMQRLNAFGHECTRRLTSQKEAIDAARGFYLSGHGGTNDGIIGAAAAVGLTAAGWAGRFIEFGRLRDFPETVTVSVLNEKGIRVFSVDRRSAIPAPEGLVDTHNWLRPRLLAGSPVLFVRPDGLNRWRTIDERKVSKG